MTERSPWLFRFWIAGAIFFGAAIAWMLYQGRFEWYYLATFVLFGGMAVDTWRRRRGTDRSGPS